MQHTNFDHVYICFDLDPGDMKMDRGNDILLNHGQQLCKVSEMQYNEVILQGQKGGDLTQSYGKSPYTNRNVKRASDNTNNATKKFD